MNQSLPQVSDSELDRDENFRKCVDIVEKQCKESETGPFFIDKIKKVNDVGKEQSRYLLITNQFLYNIHPNAIINKIKRKIPVSAISAVSINWYAFDLQIVIHVDNDYDYLILSGQKLKLIKVLAELRIKTVGLLYPLNIYGTDKSSLKEFTTYENDWKKNKISRRPKLPRIPMTEPLLKKDFIAIFQNKKDFLVQ